MKKNIGLLIISFLALFSSFSIFSETLLSEENLAKIFASKGTPEFEHKYKGKPIVINALLRNYCCADALENLEKRKVVWYTVLSEKGISTCPVKQSKTLQYDALKIGDGVILKGTVSVIDDWSGGDDLILHLNTGCTISAQ